MPRSGITFNQFEVADAALRGSEAALEDMMQGTRELSRSELKAAKRLVHRCLVVARMVADYALQFDSTEEGKAILNTLDEEARDEHINKGIDAALDLANSTHQCRKTQRRKRKKA